ncbi:hypothetical protein, partial [Nostoc sp.]|uniref:hypothetical protein n=1 Tax=Nostoc sp. TaxID=1180 RepID=UPI002FF891D6
RAPIYKSPHVDAFSVFTYLYIVWFFYAHLLRKFELNLTPMASCPPSPILDNLFLGVPLPEIAVRYKIPPLTL